MTGVQTCALQICISRQICRGLKSHVPISPPSKYILLSLKVGEKYYLIIYNQVLSSGIDLKIIALINKAEYRGKIFIQCLSCILHILDNLILQGCRESPLDYQ